MNEIANECSGVILAGGLNKRFSGVQKAFISIEGKTIIERVFKVFKIFFKEVIVVSNEPLSFIKLDLNIVTDIFDERSSLTGIHAGLFYAKNQKIFVSASDTPFLKEELVRKILLSSESFDITIPKTSEGFEPLCAVYSKNCIGHIENSIKRGHLQIKHFFNKVRVHEFSEKKILETDPDLISFFNINTPDDLTKIPVSN